MIESKRLTWPLKDFELPWWRRRNCREISVDRCGQRSVARRASNCWRRWPAGCDSRPPPGASAATPPAAGSRPFTNKMQQNVNKTNARPSFNGLVFHRKTLKRQKKKFEFRYKSPRWDFMTMKSNDSPDMHKWVHRTCRWPCSKHPNWLAGWVSSRAQSAGRDKKEIQWSSMPSNSSVNCVLLKLNAKSCNESVQGQRSIDQMNEMNQLKWSRRWVTKQNFLVSIDKFSDWIFKCHRIPVLSL